MIFILAHLLMNLSAFAQIESKHEHQAQDYCRRKLSERHKVIKATDEPIEGAPGLRMISGEIEGHDLVLEKLLIAEGLTFRPHELRSAAKYAAFVHQKSRETVLLAASQVKTSVPGFDGVIYNSKNEPIANISLKTVIGQPSKPGIEPIPNESAAKFRALQGIERAVAFSDYREWFSSTGFIKKNVRGLPGGKEKTVYYQTKDPGLKRKPLLEWICSTLKLFGKHDDVIAKDFVIRPTRVVVDIQSSAPFPNAEQLKFLEEKMKEHPKVIEKIIFMKDGFAPVELSVRAW